MPLTFAHPAAVLPLVRGPLVPTALVAGALAPDVPYFLRATRVPVSAQSWWEPFFNATTTHSWPGFITVAIPVTLVLYLAIAFCKKPTLWALPASTQQENSAKLTWYTSVGLIGASLFLGVLTHVLWDSFTHSDGWFVEHIAVLRANAVASLTWARLLQHLSTLVGLLAISLYAWLHRDAWLVASDPIRRRRYHRVACLLVIAMSVAAFAVVVVRHEDGAGMEHLLTSLAIGAGLGAVAAAVVMPLLWWVKRPDHRKQTIGSAEDTAHSLQRP